MNAIKEEAKAAVRIAAAADLLARQELVPGDGPEGLVIELVPVSLEDALEMLDNAYVVEWQSVGVIDTFMLRLEVDDGVVLFPLVNRPS